MYLMSNGSSESLKSCSRMSHDLRFGGCRPGLIAKAYQRVGIQVLWHDPSRVDEIKGVHIDAARADNNNYSNSLGGGVVSQAVEVKK
jgi:hypothetical protein